MRDLTRLMIVDMLYFVGEQVSNVVPNVDDIIDKKLIISNDVTWIEKQCSDFQYKEAAKLEGHGIDKKTAQIEVSWFVDRYGLKIKNA